MTKIKVSVSGSQKDIILRQIPDSSGYWRGCQFLIKDDVDKYDWWVVLHHTGITNLETAICDPSHLIYVSLEPRESVGNVNSQFLSQFSKIITPDRSVVHPGLINQGFHTWWAGMNVQHKNNHHNILSDKATKYEEFSTKKVPDKKNRISIITSQKKTLPGHTKRLDFINKLLQHPISKFVDIYGDGYNPIQDKLDAISGYKYHLVIENDNIENYWTEKLADSFLGFAMPIYYGCPNISDYFDAKSMIHIDIKNVDQSISIISDAINHGIYDSSLDAIKNARKLVMNEYNIFNQLSNICNVPAVDYKHVELRPNRFYNDTWYINFVKNGFHKLPHKLQQALRNLI